MSQIASFYALPADRFDDLVAAATPKVVTIETRRLLFLKTRTQQSVDEFGAFLGAVARKCEECTCPGYFFSDLDALLNTRGLLLFDLARRDLSDRLSQARDLVLAQSKTPAWVRPLRSKIPVFDHTAATAARDKLQAHPLREHDVRAHAREEYGVEDEEPATATILAAFDLTKRWLGCVRKEEVAFLSVG